MIFGVQKLKKRKGAFLLLFLFLSAIVSSLNLLFSNEPFFNGVNPDFQTTLTSDAGDPDEDGNFDLIWTRS